MRDVIVIGAGGGGAVIAKELAARGLDVLVLEAGAFHTQSEKDFTHFEMDMSSLTGVFRFGPSDRTRPPWQRELAQHSIISQVAGVGGTTKHYFGNSPRAMPGVFRGYAGSDKNSYDRAHEFPLRYEDLIPYYEWVEKTLPVQTAPMGIKEKLFLEAAERLGLHYQTGKNIAQDSFRPQENAILQPAGLAGKVSNPHFDKAQGCTFCGHCFQGCIDPLGAPRNLKAKRSTDNSYMPMAVTADQWARRGKAVTVVPNAYATKIRTTIVGGDAFARGVTWRDTISGAVTSEDAKVIVLSAGAIESPRLWLNSALPDPYHLAGTGLTDHHFDLIVGRTDFDAGLTRGPGSAARADFPNRGAIEPVTTMPGGILEFTVLTDSGTIGTPGNNTTDPGKAGADAVGRLAGDALKDFYRNIDNLMLMLVITDDDVEPTKNSVALSTQADENGRIPLVTVDGRNRSARTKQNREFLARKSVEILRRAGARKVVRVNLPPTLIHIQSSLRMGADASSSLLDSTGEARCVRRLFVADASALANSVGGVNPTLTVQALATRTAEQLFQRYFNGNAWVKFETPLSSIDPLVTRAVRNSVYS